MHFQIIQPTGFLKNFIRHYCFMESDALEGDVMERVIPTENIQLMFHYKTPFVVCNSDDTFTCQPRSIISGLCDSYSDVSTNGETGVVFISFYPTGACHFFNFPLSEIENISIDLCDIFSREVMNVEEMLCMKETITEKVAVIEEFLLRRFSPIPLHDNLLIRKGIGIIKGSRGQTTVSSLSDTLYTSSKSLERKFSQYLGKSTKQVIKLIRFQAILQDFSFNKNLNLTERAYSNGYFDQSHFIKDFKTYSGYTPKEFVTRYPDFNLNADSH